MAGPLDDQAPASLTGGGERASAVTPAEGPPPAARASLLDAGASLVSERRTSEVLPGVREVCQRAGRSTAVFYCHFDSLATYHSALIDQLLSTDIAFEVMASTMELLADVTMKIRTGPPEEIPGLIACVAAANVDAQLSIGMTAFRNRLLLQATADDQARRVAIEALQRLYVHVTAVQVLGYKTLLEIWGREPRPPYDLEAVAVTITAVADGLLLRQGFEPELAVTTLFEDAVRSLIPSFTRRIGDTDDLDAMLRRSFRPSPGETP